MSEAKTQQQEDCCQGDEMLCISIPGIDVTILGNLFRVDPICLKIPSNGMFGADQAINLQSVMNYISNKNVSSSGELNNTDQITQIQGIIDSIGASSGELTEDQILQMKNLMKLLNK